MIALMGTILVPLITHYRSPSLTVQAALAGGLPFAHNLSVHTDPAACPDAAVSARAFEVTFSRNLAPRQ